MLLVRRPRAANNTSTVRPTNIGNTYGSRSELLSEIDLYEKVKLLSEKNYSYFNRVGSLDTTVFDFYASQWSMELTAKFKLPKDLDIELSGQNQSGYQTIQDNVRYQLFANMVLRKKLFKNKGVINFGINDIFASRIRQTITDQTDFYILSRSYRGRFMTLGFSYGFGKGEAMEFSGRRRRYFSKYLLGIEEHQTSIFHTN